ncbi:MAG: hypothetical protein WB643_11605 [Candidatus Bathyarchaeia archaeon]
MKRILVTLLVLLSMIALIQFSPTVPQAFAVPNVLQKATLTFNAPSNSTTAVSAYGTITVKVFTNPMTTAHDVKIYFNTANANFTNCPRTSGTAANASSTGTFTCNYQLETLTNTTTTTYHFQATASLTGGPNLPYLTTQTATSGVFSLNAGPALVQIPLVAGWNLISLPIVPASTAILNVLASQAAGANLTIVWAYKGGSWKSATLTAAHTFTGPLSTMQDGVGYWIYMTKADNLTVVGSIFPLPPATPPSYPLSAGWNLIGFKPEPTILSENVTFYLQSLGTKYDNNSVWTYSNSLGTWTRNACGYAPVGLPTCAYVLTPGEGLWVYMTAAGTLYP